MPTAEVLSIYNVMCLTKRISISAGLGENNEKKDFMFIADIDNAEHRRIIRVCINFC